MVQISKNLGRYNLCSNDKQWCVALRFPDGKGISETWPEDEEPDIEGNPPSEVIEMISKRVEGYFINSSREKSRETIAWVREHAEELDRSWAEEQIQIEQRSIDRAMARIDRLRANYLAAA